MKFPDYQPGDLVVVNRDWTWLGLNYPKKGDTVEIDSFAYLDGDKEPVYYIKLNGGGRRAFWAGHFSFKQRCSVIKSFLLKIEEEVCKAT